MSYDKYADKPKGETKKAYRARMRAERGDRWWRPPPPPDDLYGHAGYSKYETTATGAPLYAPVPANSTAFRSFPEAKGWPKPDRADDMYDPKVMPDGSIIYMHIEWLVAFIFTPTPGGPGWHAFVVDVESACDNDLEGQLIVAPVEESESFSSKAALKRAMGPGRKWEMS